jgi:hypothetical protein
MKYSFRCVLFFVGHATLSCVVEIGNPLICMNTGVISHRLHKIPLSFLYSDYCSNLKVISSLSRADFAVNAPSSGALALCMLRSAALCEFLSSPLAFASPPVSLCVSDICLDRCIRCYDTIPLIRA